MLDFIIDILIGAKYGFGSVAWGWVAGACFVISLLLFRGDHYILGTIGIIGFIVCSVYEIRQFSSDVRYKRYKQKTEDQKNEAKKD